MEQEEWKKRRAKREAQAREEAAIAEETRNETRRQDRRAIAAMGFDAQLVASAYRANGGEKQKTIDELVAVRDAAAAAEAEKRQQRDARIRGRKEALVSERLQQALAMGFPEDATKAVFQANGCDLERTINALMGGAAGGAAGGATGGASSWGGSSWGASPVAASPVQRAASPGGRGGGGGGARRRLGRGGGRRRRRSRVGLRGMYRAQRALVPCLRRVR